MAVHCQPLIRFLASASLRRRRARIIYVHVPKTGGTSMWASLTRAFPSHVYYPILGAYLSNPPTANEYDLIGLHFSPAVLLDSLAADDWVIGMVRDPTQRFLSGVAHARRATEDPLTFTASARAMREMELADYVTTELGRAEARLQLIIFGSGCPQPSEIPSDEEMLGAALSFARRENVILAPSERSHAFRDCVARALSFRPGVLGRLNANEPAGSAAHRHEFERVIGLVNAVNRCEREFYDFVCKSFAVGHAVGRKRSSGPPGMAASLLYAPVHMRAALG
jgi:hypothetical protein